MDTSETDKLIQEWIDKYRYEDGKLYYKKSRFKSKIGKEVKTYITNRGYVYFNDTASKKRNIHKVIFAMFHRKIPQFIDHIDRNPLNNRIENLRETTRQLNQLNTNMYATNKSGFRGVSFYKQSKKWRAAICIQKKYIHLGLYDTKEEAYAARVAYEKQLNIHHIIYPDSHAINI